MTAKYWIKLYHEILHDPKMARMDDHLYRRTIELFLLAGEHGDDGSLPSLTDMSWTLRAEPEQLETELVELQRLGIISVIDGCYIVTKFTQRQAANSPAERMRMMRERNKSVQYYGDTPVTTRNTEPDKRREDIEIDVTPKELTPFQIISTKFMNLTHIPERFEPKWVDGINKLVSMGVTEEILTLAVEELGTKYNLSGPWSVINACANVMRKNGHEKQDRPMTIEEENAEILRKIGM